MKITISEGFGVIVEIPFSLLLVSSLEGKEIANYHNLLSIHSILTFLEDKFPHLKYVSDILIPHPIHLEILVQTLQWKMPLLCMYYDSFYTSIIIEIVWLLQRNQFPFFQKEIKDFSYSYIILLHVNTTLSSFLSAINLIIYDQHLIEK